MWYIVLHSETWNARSTLTRRDRYSAMGSDPPPPGGRGWDLLPAYFFLPAHIFDELSQLPRRFLLMFLKMCCCCCCCCCTSKGRNGYLHLSGKADFLRSAPVRQQFAAKNL